MRKSSCAIAEDLCPITVSTLRAGYVNIAGTAEFDGVKGRLAQRVDPLFNPDDKSPVRADLPGTLRVCSADTKSYFWNISTNIFTFLDLGIVEFYFDPHRIQMCDVISGRPLTIYSDSVDLDVSDGESDVCTGRRTLDGHETS